MHQHYVNKLEMSGTGSCTIVWTHIKTAHTTQTFMTEYGYPRVRRIENNGCTISIKRGMRTSDTSRGMKTTVSLYFCLTFLEWQQHMQRPKIKQESVQEG